MVVGGGFVARSITHERLLRSAFFCLLILLLILFGIFIITYSVYLKCERYYSFFILSEEVSVIIEVRGELSAIVRNLREVSIIIPNNEVKINIKQSFLSLIIKFYSSDAKEIELTMYLLFVMT